MPAALPRRDLLVAIALAALMGVGWTWAAWVDPRQPALIGLIDLRGLQLVLLLGAAVATTRPAGAGVGVITGVTAAASLALGPEAMPLFAVLGLVAIVGWVRGVEGAGERLQGLGVGALVGLAAAKGLFRTDGWDRSACDGFTASAWRAGVALAVVPLLLAGADRIADWRVRAGIALASSAVMASIAVAIAPACRRLLG